LLHEHEGELHKEEIDYITNFTFTESYFYGLPKVHKSEVISNAILEQHTECIKILNPNDLEFRPIVGGPPKCYCRNSQIVRNICIKNYNIKTDEFRIWIYGRRQII
jgi:hypothetical protein